MQNVSIVIPSYKGVHLYEKNLDSVLACMRHGDELIVVDDASGPDDDTITWFQDKFQVEQQSFTEFDADFYLGFYESLSEKSHSAASLQTSVKRSVFSPQVGFTTIV
jgi:GT2 family glycosyltransferase